MLKRKFVATLFGELVRLIPTSSKVVFRVAAADLAAVPPKPSAVTLLDPIWSNLHNVWYRTLTKYMTHIIIWLWKKRYLVRPFFHHSFISLILMYCRNCKTMFDSRKLCSHLWGWHIQYCTAIRRRWQSLTLMRNFIMTPVTPCFKAFPSPAAQATVASLSVQWQCLNGRNSAAFQGDWWVQGHSPSIL